MKGRDRYALDIRGGSLPVGIDSHLPAAAKRTRLGIIDIHVGGIAAPDKGRPFQPVFTRHPDSFGFKNINSFLYCNTIIPQ